MRHGGSLGEARAAYGEPAEGWLDLSTGINPYAYGLALSPDVLARLPDPADLRRLEAVARDAYRAPGHAAVAAGPGTQGLVQILPFLFAARRVAVVGPTYSEHAAAWARAGHQVTEAPDLEATRTDIVVLVNPNNPDGRITPKETVLDLAGHLECRGGLLIVDEAFADVAPAVSVADAAGRPGLLVLRSFGKFYGLAGVRLGFALGPEDIIARLRDCLGPWPVSGPALAAGLAALADHAWTASMRVQLAAAALALDARLARHGLAVVGGTSLFRLVETRDASWLHHVLAHQGVWTRYFAQWPYWLRIGLPPGHAGLDRLDRALARALGAETSGARGAFGAAPAARRGHA